MRRLLPLIVAAGLLSPILSNPQVVTAWEPGHFVALSAQTDIDFAVLTGQRSRIVAHAARQDLRDEVCLAMADGRITPTERYQIMSDAKRVLKPEEYQGLQRALDRISRSKAAAKQMPQTAWHARQLSSAQARADSVSSPVIPASVILPD